MRHLKMNLAKLMEDGIWYLKVTQLAILWGKEKWRKWSSSIQKSISNSKISPQIIWRVDKIIVIDLFWQKHGC